MPWDGKIRYDTITLKNLVTNKSLILFDSPEDTGIVLESVDFGHVTGNTEFVTNVGQTGFDKLFTYLGTREIEIVGWVYAGNYDKTKFTSDYKYLEHLRKTYLNSFINPFQDIRCEYKDYYINFTPNTSIQYGKDYKTDNNEVMCKFLIQGTAGVPVFMYKNPFDVIDTPKVAARHFEQILPEEEYQPEVFIFGELISNGEMIINNEGDIPVGFNLDINSNSTIVNPTIVTKSGDVTYRATFMLELPSGYHLIVNTEYGKEEAYVKDSSGQITVPNALLWLTQSSELPVLNVGENIVEIHDDQSILITTTSIKYNPMFLEVM